MMIELKKLNVHRIVESEEAAARLEADGFTVVTNEARPDFSGMKIDELRAYAEGKNIDIGSATKKEDIIKAIQSALAAAKSKATADSSATPPTK